MCPAERRSRRQGGFPRDQFARAASSTPSYGAGGGVAGASVVGVGEGVVGATAGLGLSHAATLTIPRARQRVCRIFMETSDSERESSRGFAPFWVIYLTGMSG